MVISTIVYNPTIETCGMISEMLFMGIEGNNAVSLSYPRKFEIYDYWSCSHQIETFWFRAMCFSPSPVFF